MTNPKLVDAELLAEGYQEMAKRAEQEMNDWQAIKKEQGIKMKTEFVYDNPEDFFKKLEEVLGVYNVVADANPITKIYTIKITSLKKAKKE